VAVAGRPAPSKFARKDDQHVHGSAACVSAYLGEKNWTLTVVKEHLQIEDRLDDSLKKEIAARTTHPERQEDNSCSLCERGLVRGKNNASKIYKARGSR
jgi:hypothetical protein